MKLYLAQARKLTFSSTIMSLRNYMPYLKTFNLKNNHIFPYVCKYQVSSFSSKTQSQTSENIENIRFPKHIQPLLNQSVDEIFSSLSSRIISESESVSILKMLRMFTLFKNENSDNFKNDQRFQILCNIFEKSCDRIHPNLLVSGLRSLLEVGVSPNSNCVIAAEKSIINNIHLFSTFNLIGCLYFHHKFMQTDLQKEVVALLTNELCKRIPEITTNVEVLMLTHFLHIFNEDHEKKMQLKIEESIRTFNIHELCKIFNILAENSNRNVVILNALAFHLQDKDDALQVKEIVDILYSFKKLNFFHMGLISNLMVQVIREIPSVKQPSVISGILTVCGHSRLRHTGVLNACAGWIVSHTNICRPKEYVSFVLTIAVLNYNSPAVQKALDRILPVVSEEKVNSSDIWLDYVWSLAILNIVDKEMLLKVLSPSFYKPLIDNSGFQVTTNKLKLMNLKSVLKKSYPEYVFGCNLFLDPIKIPQSSEVQNSKKHVLKILNNFVPGDKYLCTDQSTDMGIFIDAEFIMNENMKPLPFSKFGILSKATDTLPLPKGAQRIAILVLFYKDFTLCSPSITGFNNLSINLLFSQGYTPVPIDFSEFMKNKTEVKKAKYLLHKITSIMKNVTKNGYKFDIKLFN